MRQRHLVVLEIHHFHQASQPFIGREDAPDELLAAAVVRVCLAAEQDLHLSDIPRDFRQPLDVGEDEIRPLVRRGAPRESDRHHRRIEHDAGATLHFVDQRHLAQGMRVANLLERDAHRIP